MMKQVDAILVLGHRLDKDGNPALDENGQVIYEEASAVSVMYTVEVFASEGWTKTLSNLPVTSDDRKEKYTYSAREVGTDDVLEPDENGIVTLEIENKGIMNRIMQKIPNRN